MDAVGQDRAGNGATGQGQGEAVLHSHDLIDDRALTVEEDDEFQLRDVVAEVAQLCESAAVPATLAIYGSWGSGKSSLANLLRAKFIRKRRLGFGAARNREVAFAIFDAFKYAQVPLRRQFISQLAHEFKIKSSEFSEGLYTTTRDFRLKIPPRKWFALLVALLVAVLIMSVVAGVVASVYAWISKGAFRADFTRALRTSIPGVALGAPLLAAGIGLLGSYFTAETMIEAPSSDEQFERLFRKLVKRIKKKQGCERIVIFIDELDRCSPGEVVSTLETLRTFLEVSPCIFIVAADQQALEHALTDAARQATPFNPANPYYSAGSAYLDKIFQYQLPLPPILSRRLSRFALELIENRAGVWALVPNRAELVSVLVPTHISSPRRVKALLNSFALLYRLAVTRSQNGTIEQGVEARASEVAKLSCLRTEFPLFADDLRLDHRLPQIVLKLHDQPDLTDDELVGEFGGVAPEALMRARAYAREELPVDQVIAQRPTSRKVRSEREVEEPETDEGEGAAGDAAEEADVTSADVKRSHARQLIRYLQRTDSIPGPLRDLVYLESSGAAFGLVAELAEQLERDAVDGRVQELEKTFAGLNDTDQENALRLLARMIVESEAVGIEAANVIRSIFRAMAVRKADLAPVAEDLLNALVTHNAGYEPKPDELRGALALALSDDGESAERMRKDVLERDEVLDDDALGHMVLTHTEALWPERDRIAEVFAAVLFSGAELAADALAQVPDDLVIELIRSADVSDEATDDETADEEESSDEEAGEGKTIEGLAQFVETVLSQGRAAVAQAGFARLVSLDDEAAGSAVTRLIPSFTPITDRDLSIAFLDRVQHRPAREWATWLAALDASTVGALSDAPDALNAYTVRLWRKRFNPASPEEALPEAEFVGIAKEIGRLRGAAGTATEKQTDLLEDEPPVVLSATVAYHEERFAALGELVDAGALEQSVASASILGDLGRTLSASLDSVTGESVTDYVLKNAVDALAGADADTVTGFLEDAEESPWLDGTPLEIARVRCALAQRQLSPADTDPPDETTLEALVAAGTAPADQAVADWVTGFNPDAATVFHIVEPRTRDGARLEGPLKEAIGEASSRWTPKEKAELLARFAPAFIRGELDGSVVRAAGLSDADAERATQTLIESFEAAGNNDERRAVMDLWREVNPAPNHLRSKLINRIYLPLVEGGKGAANIAVGYFDLVRNAPTQAAQKRVKKAIGAAAKGEKDLQKRAEKRLREAGWIAKRWFKL